MERRKRIYCRRAGTLCKMKIVYLSVYKRISRKPIDTRRNIQRTVGAFGRKTQRYKKETLPIPAALGMIYYKDKYYKENEVLYLCTRDSVNELYHMPSVPVGHYFEKV